jgi:protein phosphatase
MTVIRPRAGDRFLLCSDGLSDVVDDATIADLLRDCSDLDDCAQQLVNAALRNGGRDNITTVIADVVEA